MSHELPQIGQLATYLIKRGWREKSGRRRLDLTSGTGFRSDHEVTFRAFDLGTPGQSESRRIVLPINENGECPPRFIENALQTLSTIYRQKFSELAEIIRTFNLDVLFGIHPKSTISLARAHDIIANLKNIIAQSANAEIDPKPHSPEPRANSIVDDVNFGHTFAGSFGFRVECPLSTSSRQMEIDGQVPPPLERRTLERLAFGFMTVDLAAQENDISPVCDNYRIGFTANICDAVLKICEPSDVDNFRFRFEWSSLFPLNERLLKDEHVFDVNARKYALIRSASAALKEMVVLERTSLVGRVVVLSSDVAPLQKALLAHRKITIQTRGGEYNGLKMQFEVSDTDYNIAFEAHGAGELIAVEGRPVQRGTHWRLEEYTNLRRV